MLMSNDIKYQKKFHSNRGSVSNSFEQIQVGLVRYADGCGGVT